MARRKWHIALAVAGLAAAGAGTVHGVQPALIQLAQLESIQRQGGEAAVPPPRPRVVEPAFRKREPDTTGVWYHVRRKDFPRARAELDRLQSTNPQWAPPDDLKSAVNGFSPPPSAPSGVPAAPDDYERRLALAEVVIQTQHREPSFLTELAAVMRGRKDANGAERLGRATAAAGMPNAAIAWFESAASWAMPGSAQESAAMNGLTSVYVGLQRWDVATARLAQLPPGPVRAQATQILADGAAQAAQTAAKAGDWARAAQLAAAAEASGASRVHTDLGWVALDAGDKVRAAASFATGQQSEESRYGRILALSDPARDSDALMQVCVPEVRSERAAAACGDAFAAKSLAAYEKEDWAATVRFDTHARRLGLSRSGTRLLAGWSEFRLGRYQAAVENFDSVAAQEPGAADGVVQSLMAAKRYDDLETRAQKGSVAFVDAYRKEFGGLALNRKRMLVAAKAGVPGAEGVATTTATVGASVREKSGASGADRLTWKAANVEASTVVGTQKFSAGVEYGHLHTGVPNPNTPIGSLQPSAVTPPAGTPLVMPWFRWMKESVDSLITAAIGTTPIGGAIDPLPVGAISAQFDGDKIIATGTLRAAPRYDSLLSMGGLRDGATGTTWGRVVEIGPQASTVVLLTPQVSVSANVGASTIRGHNVRSNKHLSGAASLTYEFEAGGFDYIRTGLSYGFDHYTRNHNFFTIGHGGYYSPNQAHNVGGFLDVLTPEGRTWQVGARATASYQYSIESAAPRLPLAPDGTFFPRIRQSQFGTDSSVRASVLLAPRLILSGYGQLTYSPSGRDATVGLSLSVPFTSRTALFSSDLPRTSNRTWP